MLTLWMADGYELSRSVLLSQKVRVWYTCTQQALYWYNQDAELTCNIFSRALFRIFE